MSSIHLEKKMEVEADRFARRKVERLEGEIPFTTARATAAGASRGDDSVGDGKENIEKQKRNSQGKDPRTCEDKSQGKDLRTSSVWDPNESK